MIILLHSSKTMKSQPLPSGEPIQNPALISKTSQLAEYLKTLSDNQIADSMKVSPVLASKTHSLLASWSANKDLSIALDTFKGDIYSGLQAPDFTQAQRQYANKHLVILSGLYGLIRPLDAIHPYRLELMYRLPDEPYKNLYKFWGEEVSKQIPESGLIANLSSVEYSKLITPFIDPGRVISPQFFTVDPKTNEPKFVTVHSKIARGAFARWLIQTKTQKTADFNKFNLLGYKYNKELSLANQPAFVAEEFAGIGLSLRLT